MRRRIFSLRWGILLSVIIVGLVFGMLADVKAAAEKAYYQGKIITFVVGTAAGGGTDLFARLISRHLGRFIPGNPTIVVRNMTGAAGLIGANFVWHSKPNGLTCLTSSGGRVTENITRPKGTEFKLEEGYPVYSSPAGLVIFAKSDIITKPKDILTAKGLIFGGEDPTAGTAGLFIWVKELLGFESKIVFGYAGQGPARMAFLSGESNITGESTLAYNASVKPYVDKGQVVPVFQSGILDENGNVVREPAAPDVPTVLELYKQIHGKDPSGPVWEVYKLMVKTRTYGKAIVFPPGIPPQTANLLGKAAVNMVKDEKFLKESEKINPGAPHYVGEAFVRSYPQGVTGSPEVVKFMKKVLVEKYAVVVD